MRYSLFNIMLSVLVCSFTNSYTQEVFSVSGGIAVGGGGSASYTAGQIFYSFHIGKTGSVTEGIQQTYEISAVTVVQNVVNTGTVISVFPNPATAKLILKIYNFDPEDISYQLFAINGRMIMAGTISEEETIINLGISSSSLYLLKIIENKSVIKTFRIIKH